METRKRIRQSSVYDELTNDELKTLVQWKNDESYQIIVRLVRAKRYNHVAKLFSFPLDENTVYQLAECRGAYLENVKVLSIPDMAEKILKNRTELTQKNK